MRIGLITTLNTNIGDDFIREGICNVLKEVFSHDELQFVPVNKHDPVTLYPQKHPLRRLRTWVKGGWRRQQWAYRASRALRRLGKTHFDTCDAIVQCGAPVYWRGCGKETVWRQDLWQDVVARLHRKIPVLNLAAGSCFAYRGQPSRFEADDEAYVQWLYQLCRTTTVRDQLAARLLQASDCPAELIPCSASLFTSPKMAEPTADGPILINYMRGAGHFDWHKEVDASAWERTVRAVIDELRQRHRIVMLCHDGKELALARELAPDLEHVLPQTYHDFPRLVRQAKAALCNRMHASVALAGMGIPSVAVGTDTRLLMVEQFGLPCHYVLDTNARELVVEVERLIGQKAEIAERLARQQKNTFQAYQRVLQPLASMLSKSQSEQELASV